MLGLNLSYQSVEKDFAELKKQGISSYLVTVITSREHKPVVRRTAKGVCSYAGRAYIKYGDGVRVEVGYFDEGLNYQLYCIYA